MPAIVRTRAIVCPNCGGSVQLRGFAHTLTVTCANCKTLLDTSSGEASILAQAQTKYTVEPLIPLGSRGKFEGVVFEVIGFQQRYINADGETFAWQEYVLFHPYKGFRYLSEYEGHWNYVRGTEVLPQGILNKQFGNQVYRIFQKSVARTGFVLGEFPWQVAVGEALTVVDYVAPPYVLSSESSANETTWSIGTYMDGHDVWAAFGLKDKPPKTQGVYSNQPNPHAGRPGARWKLFFAFAVLMLVILFGFAASHKSEPVWATNQIFNPASQNDQAVVSPVFNLGGTHSTAVRLETRAKVSQNWLYLAISLVNQETNESYDFSETLSYYSGVDDGESWSEGSSTGGTSIHRVPPGKYYVRIDPERDAESGESQAAAAQPIEYTVKVFQGSPNYGLYFIMILLLLPPPIIAWLRYRWFETRRWNESDVSGASGSSASSSGGDDD